MSILIFALLVILIVALAIYAIDLMPFDGRLNPLAKIIVVVIAIIVICERAGLI